MNGACHRIETILNKTFLNLVYRHHVFEFLLTVAFKECLKDISTGPDIPFFQSFEENWGKINTSDYQCALDNPEISPYILEKRNLKFFL